MRFAIPLAQGKLAEHFGHCEAFAFIDVDPDIRTVLASSEAPAPEHQPGLLPGWLHERGVTHVIAGNIGDRARKGLSAERIELFAGAPPLAPAAVVQQYLDGTLVAGPIHCHH